MLEVEQLESYIAEHALPVDLDIGLLFTLVLYGEEIVPEVTARLDSPSCVVRANAAYTLGMLLPPVIPPAIETMAASDGCDRARHSSMRSLAIADPPALFRVLNKQLSDSQQPEQSELMAILEALSLAPPRQAIPYLEKLSRDNDNVVAQTAATTLEMFQMLAKGERVPRLSNTKDTQARSQLLRDLNMAVEKKRFKSSMAPVDMVALLQDEDYSLLNKARVSVLRRFSDECLGEFVILHAATLSFREARRLSQ
jgi:HEAT repeat protein